MITLFFNFYNYDPYLFIYTCLFAFLKSLKLFLGTHPINNSGKSISQYALYSLIFSQSRSVINREQHKKNLYNQTTIAENTECTIVKVPTPVIDTKVGMSP